MAARGARWWWDDRNYYLAVQRTNLCCVPLMCRKVIQQPSFVLQYPHQPFYLHPPQPHNALSAMIIPRQHFSTSKYLRIFPLQKPMINYSEKFGVASFAPQIKVLKGRKLRVCVLNSFLHSCPGKEHTDSITDDIYTPMGSLIEYT